jgi:hypothetical protein
VAGDDKSPAEAESGKFASVHGLIGRGGGDAEENGGFFDGEGELLGRQGRGWIHVRRSCSRSKPTEPVATRLMAAARTRGFIT